MPPRRRSCQARGIGRGSFHDARPAAILDAALLAGLSPDRLSPAIQQASGTAPATARPVRYIVRPGDSLSSIAGRFYHKQSAWAALYWVNRGKIRWANVLSAGQVLRIPAEPAKIPAAPGQLGPAVTGVRRGPVVSLDRHKQLVLHVGQALALSLVLAPALETAQRDPELQQPLEVLLG